MTELSRPADGESAIAAALLAPETPAPRAVAEPRRFAVYRNNVVVGLIDAIAATYPAVLSLVGEDFFRAAAREFVLAHPPGSPVLIEYGGAFPDWIAAFPPAAGVPYLGDVARLEWAWNRAYNAADAQVLDGGALAELTPEEMTASRVVFHPSMALISSPFPVVSLWAQATRRVPATDLDLAAAETGLIVRPREQVDVRAVSPAMAAFLQDLRQGAAVGSALTGLNSDQALLAECLSGLFQLGLVVSLQAEDGAADQTQKEQGSAR
ncbi:MAG: DNA-binding domain-containing protein [Pseudomonadota bacterium]